VFRWIPEWLAALRVRLMFLLVRLLPLVTPKHNALGIRTYLAIADETLLARAKEQISLSIGLLAHYEPRRYARVKSDLRGILVHPFSTRPRARYNRSTRLCELSPSLATSGDIVAIASSIVHEAVHARLRRLPIGDAERRVRVEHVCISEQIAFLDRLPGTAHRADNLRMVLV